MPIKAAEIKKQFGDYYINAGQNEKDLKRLFLFINSFAANATIMPTNDTVLRLGMSHIGEIIQAFQTKWTPKGDLKFTPNEIPLSPLKVDVVLNPDDIEQSWLGFLASNRLERKEWPLVRYMIEKHLLPQIIHDLESQVLYKGKKGTITSGTATTANASMDGLKEWLKKGVANDTINILPSTTFNQSTIYDQMEELYENINEEYQHAEMNIYVSPKLYRWFKRDKRTLGYYDNINGPSQINDTLDFSPAKVTPMLSMIGEDDIFITPKSNLIYGVKKQENMGRFQVESETREVRIFTDFYLGVGFLINQAVWTTMQKS